MAVVFYLGHLAVNDGLPLKHCGGCRLVDFKMFFFGGKITFELENKTIK